MSGFVILWLVLAVLLFWSIGAYNRLVRLRAQAMAAFAAIDEQFKQYVTLVQTHFPLLSGPSPQGGPGPGVAEIPMAWAGLGGAAAQFEAALQEARAQPLDAPAMSTLGAAHEILCVSWARVQNEPADLAGAPLPDTLQLQWDRISLHASKARLEFNRPVTVYNAAIAQLPARLLAWWFGFKPAKSI